MENCNANEMVGASVTRGLPGPHIEGANAHGVYTAVCIGPDGKEKWAEVFPNLVTTQGKNYLLNQGITGSAYTNIYRLSLITSATTPVVGDTYASHAGTTEAASGVQGATRKTPTFTSSTANALTSNSVAFSITGSDTISGVMLVMVANTAGNIGNVGDTATANAVLYSAGTFTGGNKTVSSGDTLNVTYTASL